MPGTFSLPENQYASTPVSVFSTQAHCNYFMFSPFLKIFRLKQCLSVHIFCKFHMACTSQFAKIWSPTNIHANGVSLWCSGQVRTLVVLLRSLLEERSVKSKLGDRSRGWTEGSLFDSYYTEVYGEGATPFLGLLHFSLDPNLRVLSKAVSSTIFDSLVWLDLELNPGLPGLWG